MLTIEEIAIKLQDRNLKAVHEKSGVSYSTLRNLASGNGFNLSVNEVRKVSDYLQGITNA
jgi:hypothetical protein